METAIRSGNELDIEYLIALDHIAQIDPDRVDFIRSAIFAGTCFVAEASGEVVGYGVLTHDFYGQGMIDMLYVQTDHRQKGIGGALVEHMAALCRKPKLFTSTNESNTPMRALLTKHGFIPSGWIENLDPGDPELVYFRAILK